MHISTAGIEWEGCRGERWWIDPPGRKIFNMENVDRTVSPFPLAVFAPASAQSTTPVIVCIQGLSAPYGWNAFLIPTILSMGLVAVLIEAPLAAERSPARDFTAHVGIDMDALASLGVTIGPNILRILMQTMSSDIATAMASLRELRGLGNGPIGLFGVSMGSLYASHAFTFGGIGNRLLGCIGHSDLQAFSSSFANPSILRAAAVVNMAPGVTDIATSVLGKQIGGMLRMSGILHEAATGSMNDINPVHHAHVVSSDRRVRFLVGDKDPLVNHEDAHRCAAAYADGAAYTVPGMGHGGGAFVEHVRNYVYTQLYDWKR